jgi:hypothetical protein
MKKVLIASLIVVSLLLLASGAMADREDYRAKWDDRCGEECPEEDNCAPECLPEETPETCPPIVINIPGITCPDIDIDLPEAPCFPNVCVGDFPDICCPDKPHFC